MSHAIQSLGPWASYLAYSFLWLALLVAILESGLMLWMKLEAARKGPEVTSDAKAKALTAQGIDPVKLLEALKALLETLKGLPAWVTLFLAGFLLLSLTAGVFGK